MYLSATATTFTSLPSASARAHAGSSICVPSASDQSTNEMRADTSVISTAAAGSPPRVSLAGAPESTAISRDAVPQPVTPVSPSPSFSRFTAATGSITGYESACSSVTIEPDASVSRELLP